MVHPADPQRTCAAPASRSSSRKGEFGTGQHEINITYADALANADHHAIYKHGVKEIAALNGVAATFMAKWTMAEAGSSCHLHSSVWNADGTESLMWDDDGAHHMSRHLPLVPGRADGDRARDGVDVRAVRELVQALPAGSWAPTAIVWSHDNRTCGFRLVGEHTGLRVESRIPGADANPYLAFAATIASGLRGIENKVEPPEMFHGNAYEAKDVPRVPTRCTRRSRRSRLEVAREAFGDFVFGHLLNTAQQEQIIFDNKSSPTGSSPGTSSAGTSARTSLGWNRLLVVGRVTADRYLPRRS